MSDPTSNDYAGKNGNGNLWRDLVKLVLISGLTAGVTTYATVQTMAKDIARIEIAVEKLINKIETYQSRLSVVEEKANERGPRINDLDVRMRVQEGRK